VLSPPRRRGARSVHIQLDSRFRGNDSSRGIFERAERRGGISLWKRAVAPHRLIQPQVPSPQHQVPFFSIRFPLSTHNYLCFLQHSGFAAKFSTVVLCFQ